MSDLSELYDRDPCKLSDQDLDKLVAAIRQSYVQQELAVKPAPKPKAPKLSKASEALKDLGLA